MKHSLRIITTLYRTYAQGVRASRLRLVFIVSAVRQSYPEVIYAYYQSSHGTDPAV